MGKRVALTILLLASLARAEEPKKYHSGQLLQTESLECTVFQSSNSDLKTADSAICQEYVLEGEDILFHLRAKDRRHSVLLPVGRQVRYRMEEDRFFLLLAGNDRKEHEYLVVAVEPREKSEPPKHTASTVNHLE